MNWESLPASEGEALTLKGFLYQGQEGQWILAHEPNLKSCCVGSLEKRASQVTLVGDFSNYSTHVPLQVRGIFHIAESGRYALTNIDSVQEQHFPIWSVGIGCLLIIGLLLARKVWRRAKNPKSL